MMPDFKEWLNRKPAGPKAKVRVRKMSVKRQRESREYTAKRKAFLIRHPRCVVVTLAKVLTGKEVPELAKGCQTRAVDIHHTRRRGKFYLDESTWVSVCRECHTFIHSHPSDARRLGLLV